MITVTNTKPRGAIAHLKGGGPSPPRGSLQNASSSITDHDSGITCPFAPWPAEVQHLTGGIGLNAQVTGQGHLCHIGHILAGLSRPAWNVCIVIWVSPMEQRRTTLGGGPTTGLASRHWGWDCRPSGKTSCRSSRAHRAPFLALRRCLCRQRGRRKGCRWKAPLH